MSLRSRLVRSYGVDLLIVIAAAESALEVVLRHGSRPAAIPPWAAASAVALVILPLLARRRFPFAAPAAAWLLAAPLSFADGRLVTFTASAALAGFAAAFLLGHLRDTAQARLGLVIVIVSAGIVVWNNPAHAGGQLIFTPALFTIGWVAGLALRVRGEQVQEAQGRASEAERERELAARIAAAEERTRIARELHDIVAHAVSVMVLQVGSVRHHLAEDLAQEKEALQDVEKTGRTALAEMRLLLGAMRRDSEEMELAPQPGLDSLAPLLDKLARAGLSVGLRVDGAPATVPDALGLSAYRIIQEGLTNALKHGRGSRAEVLVAYGTDDVEITVRNDSDVRVAHHGDRDGRGYGLVGVRERVRVYGGEMSARTLADGTFVLTARLPLRADGR